MKLNNEELQNIANFKHLGYINTAYSNITTAVNARMTIERKTFKIPDTSALMA